MLFYILTMWWERHGNLAKVVSEKEKSVSFFQGKEDALSYDG